MPQKTALLEREEAETMEALEEKCIQSNSALCASQTELKQLQKTVKDTLEQLNQAKKNYSKNHTKKN